MQSKPKIAASSCLLGHKVRYDATDRYAMGLVKALEQYFNIAPICPEVGIGLGVPRPTIHQLRVGSSERLVQADDPSLDLTSRMRDFFEQSLPELKGICGYVFKARSPSCGPGNVPIFNNKGKIVERGKGLFADSLVCEFPQLPVGDEGSLEDPVARERFIKQALAFHAR